MIIISLLPVSLKYKVVGLLGLDIKHFINKINLRPFNKVSILYGNTKNRFYTNKIMSLHVKRSMVGSYIYETILYQNNIFIGYNSVTTILTLD